MVVVVVVVVVKVMLSVVRRVRIGSDPRPVWAKKFRRSASAA